MASALPAAGDAFTEAKAAAEAGTQRSRDAKDAALLKAAAGWQPRGRAMPRLIPEYKDKKLIKINAEEAVWCQEKLKEFLVISRTFSGGLAQEGWRLLEVRMVTDGAVVGQGPPAAVGGEGLALFAVPWSPAEFVELASNLRHPFDEPPELPGRLKVAVFQVLSKGKKEVEKRREMKLKQWRSMASSCKVSDERLLEQACPRSRQVIRGRRPLLFKHILKDVGFPAPAAHLASQMLVGGVPVVGEFPVTGVFPERKHEASKTKEDVLKAAKWSRRSLAGSMRASARPDVDRAVYEKTIEELGEGQLVGAFTEEQLSEQLGPLWVAARRFGVVQGDVRACDDYSEFGHNASSSTEEKVDTGGVDVVAGLVKVWVHALARRWRSR